jgi:hypothetical protein
MRRRVDPISLLFGTLFVAVALTVLVGGSLIEDGHLFVPAGLIGLGLAMFISSRSTAVDRKAEPASGPDLAAGRTPEPEPAWDSGSEPGLPEAELEAEAALEPTVSGEYGSGDEIGAEGGEYR